LFVILRLHCEACGPLGAVNGKRLDN